MAMTSKPRLARPVYLNSINNKTARPVLDFAQKQDTETSGKLASKLRQSYLILNQSKDRRSNPKQK